VNVHAQADAPAAGTLQHFAKLVDLCADRRRERRRAARRLTGARKRIVDSWITASAEAARREIARDPAQPVSTASEYRLPPNAVPL
jgi:hypothetical protein